MSNENGVLDSAFPFMLSDVAKSATPSGSELMARTGLRDNKTKGPGKTGRPRKNGPQLLAHPSNPELTNLVFEDEQQTKIKAGSVLQVLFPDGSTQTLVLLHNTRVAPLTT